MVGLTYFGGNKQSREHTVMLSCASFILVYIFFFVCAFVLKSTSSRTIRATFPFVASHLAAGLQDDLKRLQTTTFLSISFISSIALHLYSTQHLGQKTHKDLR
jgi:hypothetical protein